LAEQAKRFGAILGVPDSFSFSVGWQSKFKLRKGLRVVQEHGEAASAPKASVDTARHAVPLVLESHTADDCYNMDETGLFWRQTPTRRLATGKQAGYKKDKTGVTAALTCNASGTRKCSLFLIGKAKRPRSFPKGFNPQTAMDIRYRNNKSAWMTAKDFSSWVTEWNSKLRRIGRKIAIICDNSATHVIPDSEEADEHGIRVINLSNIKLVFLPPNVTSHVQPLDQGIIASFKAHYRRYVVQWIIAEAQKPANAENTLSAMRPTFYQMMQWIHRAWTQDVTRDTIINCWRHANIVPAAWCAEEVADVDEDVAVVQLQAELDELAHSAQGRWDESDGAIAAENVVELDGEREVHDLLDDAQIITMVTTQGTEEPDSDEGGDPLPMPISHGDAMSSVQKLKEYVMQHPEAFGVSLCHLLDDVERKFYSLTMKSRSQADIRSLFGAGTQ
jgi:hypothetical protein